MKYFHGLFICNHLIINRLPPPPISSIFLYTSKIRIELTKQVPIFGRYSKNNNKTFLNNQKLYGIKPF
jgi:hypothetical protein